MVSKASNFDNAARAPVADFDMKIVLFQNRRDQGQAEASPGIVSALIASEESFKDVVAIFLRYSRSQIANFDY